MNLGLENSTFQHLGKNYFGDFKEGENKLKDTLYIRNLQNVIPFFQIWLANCLDDNKASVFPDYKINFLKILF